MACRLVPGDPRKVERRQGLPEVLPDRVLKFQDLVRDVDEFNPCYEEEPYEPEVESAASS